MATPISVAAQTTATAVTEDLTDLIDWVNVETFSGFTIIVENTGGGSADDITDVTIDESDDGGATSDLDQHANTPAVPITSGNSTQKTFTSTAKYLRVRAKCGAGNDTTSKAWLLADTVLGRLCLLQDVRERVGTETATTTNDTAINDIIRGVSAIFDEYCLRTFILNSTDATEYFDGGDNVIIVHRFPIVSVTSLTESPEGTYDWDNETALTENTHFRVIKTAGMIKRIVGAVFMPGVETIRLVYKGGYTAAGVTPGTGETALPNDIREAAIEQSQFTLKRRDDIGLTATSGQGLSITKFSPMDLLPMVRKILNKYRFYTD